MPISSQDPAMRAHDARAAAPHADGIVPRQDRPGTRTELRPEDQPTPPANPDDFPDEQPKKRP